MIRQVIESFDEHSSREISKKYTARDAPTGEAPRR
jgi:hypothetical protein